MLQISKRISLFLTSVLLIVTCASCKESDPYITKDYLNYLSIKSGIGNSDSFDDNFNNLVNWKIIENSDYEIINNQLDKNFLSKTIINLLEDENYNLTEGLKNNIDKNTAESIVNKAVEIINNKQFNNNYEFILNDNIKNDDGTLDINDVYYDEKDNKYKKIDENNNRVDAQVEDVYSYFDIQDSFEIDFSNCEVIPYQDELDTSYINEKYELLASKNHVFYNDGYRISYTLNTSGISVHVSKKIYKCNIFADLSINNVKSSFKYTSEDGDLSNCYFNLSMNTSEEFGFSDGKYEKYYLNLKDLDASDFKKSIDSLLLDRNEEVEARIPICRIRTPIPNIPTAFIDLELLVKFSASGKIEVVLTNSHNMGFEIKDGSARFFYDHKDDVDGIIRAGGQAALGVNVGIDAASFKLCDIELDGGVKTEAKATLHLYDNDGNVNSSQSNYDLSCLEQLSIDNPNVAICGDVSLHWLFDVIINTSKSKLYKLGFTKTIHVLDDDNQIFGNLHHIENGQFVKKCTRKSNLTSTNKNITVTSKNKIVLNSYAEVLNVGDSFNITIESLPDGYTDSDINYISMQEDVACVSNGCIYGLKPGSCKIKVYSKDNKYNSYINVLVSTG